MSRASTKGTFESLTDRTQPDDPTLAVSGLEELFPERDDNDLEAFVQKVEAVVTLSPLKASGSDPSSGAQ